MTGETSGAGQSGGGRKEPGVGERQQVGPPPRALDTQRKPSQTPSGVGPRDRFSIWVTLTTSTLNGVADETSLSGHIQSLQRSQGGTGSRSHSSPTRSQRWGLQPGGSSSQRQVGSSPSASPPAQAAPACPGSAGTAHTPVSKASCAPRSRSLCTATHGAECLDPAR